MDRPPSSSRDMHQAKPRDRDRQQSSAADSSRRPHSPPPSGPQPGRDVLPPGRREPPSAPRTGRFPNGPHRFRFPERVPHSTPHRSSISSEFRHSERSRPGDRAESDRASEDNPRRPISPSAPPPFKRKRTRSPSPKGQDRHHHSHPQHYHHHHHHNHRQHHTTPRDSRDHSPSHRGPVPARGPFGPKLPRAKSHRDVDMSPPAASETALDRSPGRKDSGNLSPYRRSRSPRPRDKERRNIRHRSTSRTSIRSRRSGRSTSPRRDSKSGGSMNTRVPVKTVSQKSARSPSPSRPTSRYRSDIGDGTDMEIGNREPSTMHDTSHPDVSGDQRPRSSRPPAEVRQPSASPRYAASNSSFHESPRPTSPYSSGRGGRGGQHHGPANNGPSIPTGPAYRGGHSSAHRGNYQGQSHDRRFSGSAAPNYNNGPSQRGRNHFSNLHWNAPGTRGRAGQASPRISDEPTTQSPRLAPQPDEKLSPKAEHDRGAHRFSDDQSSGAQESKPSSEMADASQMPPPARESSDSQTPSKGGKFSFAFKAKTIPAPAPKPVPDLAQRMQMRDVPQRPAEPSRGRIPTGPAPKPRPDGRFDRRDMGPDRPRDTVRDRDRGRNRDQDRVDRRDFRHPRSPPREPRDKRGVRRDDRRFGQQPGRRGDDKRPDARNDIARREHTPEPPPKLVRIVKRVKPRPQIAEDFAQSDSVYYRKPGNESVIGAGTYGKVFKAIHVYTERKVALKKIRMEGEKDGFPVTAVREIKLLQHLRNENIVSLLEVMVEKNECFMVFEYLSHDLTGLINHPSFTLTAAHKKDLAKQMFEGLKYLHHRGVLHRDIKAANILISNRGQLKYADFGLARFFSKSRQLDYTNRVITIWYRPPELLLGETRYGPAVDVWSAACVYVEMFTKKAVFPGEGGEISQLDKLYNCLGTPTRAEWPDIIEMPWFELMRPTERRKRIFEDVYREVLTPAALDLVAQMFRYDPVKRPSAEEVLAHPYFTSEEPTSQQAVELENIEGDWHEFESKALRKERDKEARRIEHQKEREKRKVGSAETHGEREAKRARQGPEVASEPPK